MKDHGQKLVHEAIENILKAVEKGDESKLPANWEEVLVHLMSNRDEVASLVS